MSSSKSVKCSPSKSCVIDPTASILISSLSAISKVSVSTFGVDKIGFVFAIITTLVKPPAAGDFAPL